MIRNRSIRQTILPAALVVLVCLGVIGCAGTDSSDDRTAGDAVRVIERERLQMGTRFHVQLVARNDDENAGAALDAAFDEVDRVEALLSEWLDTSQISAVNRAAGGSPVAVGPELFHVVERSVHFSEITDGAFDISFAGCGRLWSFREARVPDATKLRECLRSVDYRRIELDREQSTIRLTSDETRIGIAGIGKGYGVDRAAEVLEARGYHDYIIDGGGDIRLHGSRIDRPWTVGIAHPRGSGTLYGRLPLDRGSIVTSGDYQRSFERDGEVYHHILDPSTGMPARLSIAVTVIAGNATDADALATGLFVLGPEKGIDLVEDLEGVEALIIGPEMAVHRSSEFPDLE